MAQAAGEDLARRPQGGWIAQQIENLFMTNVLNAMTGTIANTGTGGVAQITGLSSTTNITAGRFMASGTGLPTNAKVVTVDSLTQVTLNQAATTTGSGVSITFAQFAYPVPSDFQRLIDGTLWDRTRYWQMRGPISS